MKPIVKRCFSLIANLSGSKKGVESRPPVFTIAKGSIRVLGRTLPPVAIQLGGKEDPLATVTILESGFSYAGSYSSRSAFVGIFAPLNAGYEREDLGEVLFEGQEFGCIDPPGPNSGFGVITHDQIESREGIFSVTSLRDDYAPDALADALALIDGFFIYDATREVYTHITAPAALNQIAVGGEGEEALEIVEFELD